MRADLKIEIRMKNLLEEEFGKSQGQEIFFGYVDSRKKVYPLAEEIKAKEPNLSNHGPGHIDNVLENLDSLLGDAEISAANLYILCLSMLFHDLGNLHGRERHNKKIDEIYASVKGNNAYKPEQKAVYLIVGAHTGNAGDGSKDSLKDVPDHLPLFSKEIFPQKNAAILRFADELAEGPQRTSLYLQEQGIYAENSEIYHHYANIVSIEINRKLERISAHYHIPLIFNDSIKIKTGEEFVEFRDFIFSRFNKLDQERKYCKHYCDWLNPFRKSIAILDFWDGPHLMDHDLPPIELTDLIVPEGCQNNILECYPQYNNDAIIKTLKEKHQLGGGKDEKV